MLYLDGVYAEDNYGKTRLDEKHRYDQKIAFTGRRILCWLHPHSNQ
jgi:hypothetical protein